MISPLPCKAPYSAESVWAYNLAQNRTQTVGITIWWSMRGQKFKLNLYDKSFSLILLSRVECHLLVLTVDETKRLVVYCTHFNMGVNLKEELRTGVSVKTFSLNVLPRTDHHLVTLTVVHDITQRYSAKTAASLPMLNTTRTEH